MGDSKTITLKSLSRCAALGSLYDVRKEKFCVGISMFNNQLPSNLIRQIDTPNTKYELDLSDTYETKFQKLDVQAELKLSVLSGLLTLEGSGSSI
jgi:hypothetical protein